MLTRNQIVLAAVRKYRGEPGSPERADYNRARRLKRERSPRKARAEKPGNKNAYRGLPGSPKREKYNCVESARRSNSRYNAVRSGGLLQINAEGNEMDMQTCTPLTDAMLSVTRCSSLTALSALGESLPEAVRADERFTKAVAVRLRELSKGAKK
jgi:hypothetical protein